MPESISGNRPRHIVLLGMLVTFLAVGCRSGESRSKRDGSGVGLHRSA